MGNYTGPNCRRCRREGLKLFLKGSRCDTPKCALARRDYAPGMHTWRRGRMSDYGVQLREKQKVKRHYGVMERQFRRVFEEANRQPGNTGETLLLLLERRLDNVVFRLGFAASRPEARQLVTHGHITVNERKLDIPSYLTKVGNVIGVRQREKSLKKVQERIEMTKGTPRPSWLEREESPPRGRILALPRREEISLPIQEQLVVEFCSK